MDISATDPTPGRSSVTLEAVDEATYYPVFLNLRGRRCVVLGAGVIAADKTRGLLAAGAAVTVVAIEVSPEVEQLAGGGLLSLVHRAYREGDLGGAWLAVDATGNDAVNQRSRLEAEQAGVVLNVVDRPGLCRFIAPAVVRRGPLHIAISTSGESPFLASALRARLERDLGEEWGDLTRLMGRLRRQLRERGATPAQQTRAYRAILASGIRRLLREGRESDAVASAAAICERGGRGRVSLVGAGPGDPGLLTLAGRDLLACADVVFHDALVSSRTLALCAPHARLVDVGKRGGQPSTGQAGIISALIEAARHGDHAVRLKGGDPFVFGRGGEELDELVTAGVDVTVVPGVSACIAAPALAGIPLTRRGVASSFAVISGHMASGGGGDGALERSASAVDTIVVLMPMAHLDSICERLAAVLGDDRPAALVADASLCNQATVRATLSDLPRTVRSRGLAAPATLVVGEVVSAVP